jgi:uncharacterized protein with PIN domain
MKLHKIAVRFYGALNQFLSYSRRYRTSSYVVKGQASIKDTLEALGVPHTEIERMQVNGRSVDFKYRIKDRDRVVAYPIIKKKYKGRPKFICDVHLGKLARHLRLLGLSTLYPDTLKTAALRPRMKVGRDSVQQVEPGALARKGLHFKDITDQKLIDISAKQRRILLTRDTGLLKHNKAKRAAFVYATNPDRQWKEVIQKFQLTRWIRPFRLCLECNGTIRKVAKSKVAAKLPPKVKESHQLFYQCSHCHKIYWRGSHYERLLKIVKTMASG